MGEESDHVRDLRTSTINKMFDTFLPFTPENSPDRGKLTPIGNEIKLKDFTDEVEKTGLKMNDFRLSKMKKWMDTWNANNVRNGTPTTMITRKQFHELVTVEISVFELIKKALTGQFIIPNMDDFTGKLEAIFREVAKITDGHNASYIPQLDKVDRNGWGISVTTVDGQRFNIGDTKVPFTVQSTSKAISYAIALTEYGEERVHEHIGQEPSGRLFNDISLDRQGRPWNPMINAGAIMCISLIQPEKSIGDRFDFIVNNFKKAAGQEYLGFNASVFLSERESADRNNCLAYFMKENGCYKPKKDNKTCFQDSESKFKESLELYFQICSQQTTAESASVIGATLANGGVCPTTNEKVFKPECIKSVLSLMMTCGMYDYSGEFAFAAGIPAKSGVSGSLIIVIPNLCGICCYSPPLDPIGNSVKGVAFAQRLVEKFPFHNFDYGDCGKPDPRKHPDHKEMADLVDLLFGAQVGDQAKIMEYCSKDFDFGNADYDDRTALHILCSDGHLDALRLIGDHYKKMGKRHELVKLLCEKKDRWGHTPKDEVKGENSQKVLRYINQMQKIEMENLKQGYVKH